MFLDLFYAEGVNEYEEVDEPLPSGHVQVMTIHQAKGLEFPVVIVGTLDWAMETDRDIDRDLEPYKHGPPLEPMNRISEFDQTRQYYVAMSRAQHLLAFTSAKPPLSRFGRIVGGLPDWRTVGDETLAGHRFPEAEKAVAKRRYSFTGDLTQYETCPRQYEVFRARGFAPSRTSEFFFGTLVHEAIERLHRRILEGQTLEEVAVAVPSIVYEQYHHLVTLGLRPIGELGRTDAADHVVRHIAQNRDMLARVTATETRVTLDRDAFLLVGKVDVMLGAGRGFDLIDFKASRRPEPGNPIVETYHLQLRTYANIVERQLQQPIHRLFLYWTGEETRERALMELPNRPDLVVSAGERFDRVVGAIRDKRFAVATPPPRAVCAGCDWRWSCVRDGTIEVGAG